jgi:histidyl-tRNA synthetase
MAYELSIRLRRVTKVALEYSAKNFAKHLAAADKLGAEYFICLGSDELKGGQIKVKNLITKEEQSCSADKLEELKW